MQQAVNYGQMPLLHSYVCLSSKFPSPSPDDKPSAALASLLMKIASDSSIRSQPDTRELCKSVLRQWDSKPATTSADTPATAAASIPSAGSDATAAHDHESPAVEGAGSVSDAGVADVEKHRKRGARSIQWASNDKLEHIKIYYLDKSERGNRLRSKRGSDKAGHSSLVHAQIPWTLPPSMTFTL